MRHMTSKQEAPKVPSTCTIIKGVKGSLTVRRALDAMPSTLAVCDNMHLPSMSAIDSFSALIRKALRTAE